MPLSVSGQPDLPQMALGGLGGGVMYVPSHQQYSAWVPTYIPNVRPVRSSLVSCSRWAISQIHQSI